MSVSKVSISRGYGALVRSIIIQTPKFLPLISALELTNFEKTVTVLYHLNNPFLNNGVGILQAPDDDRIRNDATVQSAAANMRAEVKPQLDRLMENITMRDADETEMRELRYQIEAALLVDLGMAANKIFEERIFGETDPEEKSERIGELAFIQHLVTYAVEQVAKEYHNKEGAKIYVVTFDDQNSSFNVVVSKPAPQEG